jgi:hypothetical protein
MTLDDMHINGTLSSWFSKIAPCYGSWLVPEAGLFGAGKNFFFSS